MMWASSVGSVLAVDLGKTGCRAALWTDASRTDAEGAGAPGLAAANGVDLAQAAILSAAQPLLRRAGLARARSVMVAAAGALAAPAAAQALAERLVASLSADRAGVTSDAVAAHAGGLAGAAGVVLAVGTGTVAMALSGGGELHRIAGWGPWLGDEGSGGWLGLAGLRAALRAEDGRGPATALREAAERRFGALRDLPAAIGGDSNPARRAAEFAPDVARATTAGDAVAAGLVAQAVRDLAAAAKAAASRLSELHPVPIALVGGLLELGPVLLDPLRAALQAGVPAIALRPASGNTLDGARLLALRPDLPHAAYVRHAAAASRAGQDTLDALATEAVRPGLEDLDQRPVGELVRLLVDAETAAHEAVRRAVPQLVAAAAAIAERMQANGRMFYLGAGTPGRLAMLDAAELGPTYGLPPDRVVALLAGGAQAMIQAIEGAEDDPNSAGAGLRAAGLRPQDAVVGITASGRTPFVVGGLRAARTTGALTVAVVNNPASPAAAAAALAVELLTGPEVVAGSTRLTAGTTQKVALNTLSTAVMVRLGKTYGARMVDVRASNAKLRRRARRMVQEITGADEAEASRALAESGGSVKPAVVALLAGVDATEAERRLAVCGGWVRAALAQSSP